jgi:hypothetical protein
MRGALSVGLVRVLLVRVCAVDTSTVVAVSIAIVPDVVIAPPDKPVPAVIDVTVPDALYPRDVHAVDPSPILNLPVSVS